MIDIEIAKTAVTVLGTFAGTIITLTKWFHGSLTRLNGRIDELSRSIAALDKNLAVQTALFETMYNRGKSK